MRLPCPSVGHHTAMLRGSFEPLKFVIPALNLVIRPPQYRRIFVSSKATNKNASENHSTKSFSKIIRQ
jgi:hypothetical protein